MAEYISYGQTEKLFSSWTIIKTTIESLKLEIELFKENNNLFKQDYLDSLVLNGMPISDMPSSNKTSDKTGDMAVNVDKIIRKEYGRSLKDMQRELYPLMIVEGKIDLSFNKLTETEKEILRMFYLEKRTWSEVLKELNEKKIFLAERAAQNIRRNAVRKLKTTSKITVELYEKVMELIDAT